jgi:DNA-binding NtrC family response regulator
MRKSVARQVGVPRRALELARVLLVHGELAPRLALQTILQAGGYMVDAAASPAEALSKLDEGNYDLVLAESDMGTQTAGRNVLAYARVKDYHPATAMITCGNPTPKFHGEGHEMSIYAENLPLLLGKVADLIGVRALRRNPALRQAV